MTNKVVKILHRSVPNRTPEISTPDLDLRFCAVPTHFNSGAGWADGFNLTEPTNMRNHPVAPMSKNFSCLGNLQKNERTCVDKCVSRQRTHLAIGVAHTDKISTQKKSGTALFSAGLSIE